MLHDTGTSVVHYDLIGTPDAPLVCMTHSLTSDTGMWAEQVQPILDAGVQVLRVDMRVQRGELGRADGAGPHVVQLLLDRGQGDRCRSLPLRARLATSDEKAAVWPQCVKHYPDYQVYQDRSTRDIPVFICEPRGAA